MTSPEGAELKQVMTEYMRINSASKIKLDEPVYLVSSTWIRNARDIADGYAQGPVGPIDNTPLLQNGALRNDIVEYQDYMLVTKDTWEYLLEHFGGGPAIPIETRMVDGRVVADVKKVKLVFKQNGEQREVFISKYRTLREAMEMTGFDLEGYIPTLNGSSRLTILDPSDSVRDAGVFYGAAIELLKRSQLPKEALETCTPGTAGLVNLGNTCFFNSGVQCLMHTIPLRDFLLSPEWEKDINTVNPIGMKGRLARAFRELTLKAWSGTTPVLRPIELKMVTGQYAPQFAGWGQQDSHELITFMLDGIHEDMNRCITKPLVDAVSGDGTNDEETAEASWQNLLKRNDSIIVDNFYGLLRSRLICPNCEKTTVVFDPYMTISLPIKPNTSTKLDFLYVPYDFCEKTSKISVTIPTPYSEAALKQNISEAIGADKKFAIAQGSRRSTNLSFRVNTSSDTKTELYVFELPDPEAFYIYFYITTPADMMGYQPKNYIGPYVLKIPSPDASDEEIEEALKEKLARCWGEPIPPLDKEEVDDIDDFIDNNCDKCFSFKLMSYMYPAAIKRRFSTTYEMTNMGSHPLMVTFGKKLKEEGSGFEFRNILVNAENLHSQNTTSQTVTLTDCFNFFSSNEVLDDMNKWLCPCCREFVCAQKKMDIWKVPECLVIHLKRFTPGYYSVTKDEREVDFPSVIDMSPHVAGPSNTEDLRYRLYAVSEHMGGLGGGHYIAHCLVGDQWYCFNDSSVSKSTEESLHTNYAYVLFYQRIK